MVNLVFQLETARPAGGVRVVAQGRAPMFNRAAERVFDRF